MQLKGLVRFFAIALILISLYQLHFTWVVRNHEKKIEQKAKAYVNANYGTASPEIRDLELKKRTRRLLDSTKGQTITYGITGAINYQKAKEQELNLGLDLQGGMSVTLEVELEGLLRSLSNNPKDPGLNKALNTAIQRKANSDADFISLFAQAYKEQNPSGRLAGIFASTQRNIKIDDSDNDVLTKIRAYADGAISNTYNVLSKRIDQFGVAQPNINLDKAKGIITVELPGVKDDPERVRKYLQATANLQFWELYNIAELDKPFGDAEKALKDYYGGAKPAADSTKRNDTASLAKKANAAAAAADTNKTASINDLIKTDTGAKAATTAKATDNTPSFFKVFQPLGPQQGKDGRNVYAPNIGYIQTRDTSTFDDYMGLDVVMAHFPSIVRFVYGMTE